MREIVLIHVVAAAVVHVLSADSAVVDAVSAENRQRMRAAVSPLLAVIAAMEVPMTTAERIQVDSVIAERILVELSVVEVWDFLVAELVVVVDFSDDFAASSVHPDCLAAEEQLESVLNEPLRLVGSVPRQFVVAHSAAVQLGHPVPAADEVFHRLSFAEVDFSVCSGHCHLAEALVVVGHLHLHPDSSSLNDAMGEKEKNNINQVAILEIFQHLLIKFHNFL